MHSPEKTGKVCALRGSFFWCRRGHKKITPRVGCAEGDPNWYRVPNTASQDDSIKIPPQSPRKQPPNAPAEADGTTRTPDPVACPRCGVVDRPLLSPGTGPHACKATCAHCGRFLRWISLLAPAERMAHRLKARMEAMQTLGKQTCKIPGWTLKLARTRELSMLFAL
jgi:hypothetical protein